MTSYEYCNGLSGTTNATEFLENVRDCTIQSELFLCHKLPVANWDLKTVTRAQEMSP